MSEPVISAAEFLPPRRSMDLFRAPDNQSILCALNPRTQTMARQRIRTQP